MKLLAPRLAVFGIVACVLSYLSLSHLEFARWKRELDEGSKMSARLDEQTQLTHLRICEKANLSEQQVRYGTR